MQVLQLCIFVLWLSRVRSNELIRSIAQSLEETSANRKAWFQQMFCGKYLNGHRVEAYSKVSVAKCGSKCIQNNLCRSFNYQLAEEKCELLSKDFCQLAEKDFKVGTDWCYYDVIVANRFETFQSCKLALRAKMVDSGLFYIKPIGQQEVIQANCSINNNGDYVTLVYHVEEDDIYVNGYEAPGSFVRQLTYNVTDVSAVVSLVDQSTNCKQYAEMKCHSSQPFYDYPIPYQYLKDRNQERIPYWAGGDDGSYCACGKTNSCAGSGDKCNCDSSYDQVDHGYITDKDKLPLTAVHGGETGDSWEWLHFTIGHLECIET